MSNITTCGPHEHPCDECGLPVDKRLKYCNLCEEQIPHDPACGCDLCFGKCPDCHDTGTVIHETRESCQRPDCSAPGKADREMNTLVLDGEA